MSQPRLFPAVYSLLAALCLGLPLSLGQSLPVITSVSGCTDVGSTTWNCTSGMTLTVHGTDFVADEGAHLYFPTSAHGETYCWMNHPITASNLTCNIYTEDRTFQVGDFLEPVAVIFPSIKGDNPRGFYETPAFAGVAFAHIAFPRIDRISGCDDSNNTDGQYTAHCDPETTTLTLTGSGFSMFTEEVSGLPGMLLHTNIGGVGAHIDWEAVSDSTFLVHLATSYTRLMAPDHYTGTPLPLSLSVFDRSTNVVYVGFVTPLPPPRIDALISTTWLVWQVPCQTSINGALGGCTPGVSVITIQGHHFYQPLSVYIGGKLCTPLFPPYPTATELYYIVPMLDNYVPGLYYDLVVNDTVYADEPEVGVMKSAIAFLPGPTLSSVVPCIATYQPDIAQFPKCSPGHVLTIVGTGFLPADPTAYMNITGIARPFSGQCSNLQVIDNEHLTCTLPDLGSVSEWCADDTVCARQHIVASHRLPVRLQQPHHGHAADRLRRPDEYDHQRHADAAELRPDRHSGDRGPQHTRPAQRPHRGVRQQPEPAPQRELQEFHQHQRRAAWPVVPPRTVRAHHIHRALYHVRLQQPLRHRVRAHRLRLSQQQQ